MNNDEYIIWRFDSKTKIPTIVTKGIFQEVAIEYFQNLVKADTKNSYAIRINRIAEKVRKDKEVK
jgi:hypothetical protein